MSSALIQVVMIIDHSKIIVHLNDRYPNSFDFIIIDLYHFRSSCWYPSIQCCLDNVNETYPMYINLGNRRQSLTYMDEIVNHLISLGYLPDKQL
jgi:hypothetical protein